LVGRCNNVTARFPRKKNGVDGKCICSFPTTEVDDLGYLKPFVRRSSLFDVRYEIPRPLCGSDAIGVFSIPDIDVDRV